MGSALLRSLVYRNVLLEQIGSALALHTSLLCVLDPWCMKIHRYIEIHNTQREASRVRATGIFPDPISSASPQCWAVHKCTEIHKSLLCISDPIYCTSQSDHLGSSCAHHLGSSCVGSSCDELGAFCVYGIPSALHTSLVWDPICCTYIPCVGSQLLFMHPLCGILLGSAGRIWCDCKCNRRYTSV